MRSDGSKARGATLGTMSLAGEGCAASRSAECPAKLSAVPRAGRGKARPPGRERRAQERFS